MQKRHTYSHVKICERQRNESKMHNQDFGLLDCILAISSSLSFCFLCLLIIVQLLFCSRYKRQLHWGTLPIHPLSANLNNCSQVKSLHVLSTFDSLVPLPHTADLTPCHLRRRPVFSSVNPVSTLLLSQEQRVLSSLTPASQTRHPT